VSASAFLAAPATGPATADMLLASDRGVGILPAAAGTAAPRGVLPLALKGVRTTGAPPSLLTLLRAVGVPCGSGGMPAEPLAAAAGPRALKQLCPAAAAAAGRVFSWPAASASGC
jgi:hypothetical protein